MKLFAEKSRLDRFDDEVHNVSWPEIRKKDILGQGAFSIVYKVQVATDDNSNKRSSLDSEKYYALKHIKPDITEDTKDFRVAAIDLAVEGEILSRLRHDNIIKLHGIYGGDPKTSYVDFNNGYFLLIDVLEDTLTRRLLKMRRIAKKKKRNGNYTMLNMVQKVAVGIAKGLQYLHENGVILRDLKVRIFFRASLAYELGLHFRI
jgi:serine/threonine protein kinase